MQITASFISAALLATGAIAQSSGTSTMKMAPSSAGSSIMMSSGTSTMKMPPSPAGSSIMMSSGTSTSSSGTKVHVIKVSDKNGSLVYTPASTSIPVGDMVQWHFYPKNHSIVQAAFSNPCEPISNVMSNVSTFYSGYMPIAATDMAMPALTMMVKSKMPFWYYCSQGKHCQAGMVGVINPPDASTGKTQEAFALKAMTAPPSTIPGMNGTMSMSSNSTSNAGSTASSAAGAAATSPKPFAGAANNLVALGLTSFVGVAMACLL